MYYIDKDGQKKLPYIVHRTSLGCYERTLAYMIEKYAGVMPLWLAPEQVRLLTVKPEQNDYAWEIANKMTALGMRVTVDDKDDNIGPKIKNARLERIPYIFVIGDKEMKEGSVTVRSRKTDDQPMVKADEIIAKLKEEIDTKAR
jgi:threonyl-tRNA synthetase